MEFIRKQKRGLRKDKGVMYKIVDALIDIADEDRGISESCAIQLKAWGCRSRKLRVYQKGG